MKESKKATFEFNVLAPFYDRMTALFRWRAPKILFEKVRDAAGGKMGSVLDIGTGTGSLATLFRDHAYSTGEAVKIAGVDLSLPMLKQGKNKNAAGLLAQADITDKHLPFQDQKFDVVTASGVLDFVGSLDNLAAEMARVAGNDGIVAVTYLPAKEGQGRVKKNMGSPLYKYSPDYIAEAFARAGVKQVTSDTVTAYTHLWPVKYGVFIGRREPD
ncbi:MAG TPA: methyltransferase domain-containing protein [Alphaproteobacteria bacterium]